MNPRQFEELVCEHHNIPSKNIDRDDRISKLESGRKYDTNHLISLTTV